MACVIWRDGRVFCGKNNFEIVEDMRKNGILTVLQTHSDFMQGVKSRVFSIHKIDISAENPDLFINDLLRHGFIKNLVSN